MQAKHARGYRVGDRALGELPEALRSCAVGAAAAPVVRHAGPDVGVSLAYLKFGHAVIQLCHPMLRALKLHPRHEEAPVLSFQLCQLYGVEHLLTKFAQRVASRCVDSCSGGSSPLKKRESAGAHSAGSLAGARSALQRELTRTSETSSMCRRIIRNASGWRFRRVVDSASSAAGVASDNRLARQRSAA
eukprot:742241-Prymnesium_polylepis.1